MVDEVIPDSTENQPEEKAPEKGVKLCPNGHKVRSKFSGRMCSSISCGKDRAAKLKAEREAAGDFGPLAVKDHPFLERAKLSKLPKSLKGDEATKWAQDKLVELLPEAVASVAYDLRYGDDKRRSEATDKVLRANGMDKRDAPSNQGGLIVLNLGQAETGKVPWLQRMTAALEIKPSAAPTALPDDEDAA